MSNTENSNEKFLYLILFGVTAVILFRLFLTAGRGLLFILPFILVAIGIYMLASYYRDKRKKKYWKNSISGKITDQITYCQLQIDDNNKEITNIDLSIADLQKHLKTDIQIADKTRQQTEKLITAFEKQKELRLTKRAFFQSAIQKLQIILHNHELFQELNKKQEMLKQLQENNYDSLANLEEIKSDLVYQQAHVDNIDKLTLRMLETKNLDNAESLTLELREMTKEIRPN